MINGELCNRTHVVVVVVVVVVVLRMESKLWIENDILFHSNIQFFFFRMNESICI